MAVSLRSLIAGRTRMEEMLEHLSDPVMLSCTQETLEDYITTAGRDPLRQMVQDQLDACDGGGAGFDAPEKDSADR